ncbi:hypothetical protein BHM03_00049966 [Ensete ventricosum]|uniref:Uncharacterized protein n=1 Tax=Ensete ventricosum TaxID=4639 RepID=A0A445MLY3_ENSVE|nr:hypothetical protein BHM03_00049966 [Ensete ventricosum]
MIILFSKGCPSPIPLPSLHHRRYPAQAAALHAVGVGNCPYGKRCYPRAAPRGRAVPPFVHAAPTGAVALAGDSPGRGAAPCGLAAGSRPLWPDRGRLPLATWPRALPTLASATLKGLWPWPTAPLQGALATIAWPWVAGPAWGLAVVGSPFSSLLSLQRSNKNA